MSKALVIFSGGQDSTTCLAWALAQFKEVEAINFNYGQKNAVEIESAKRICHEWDVQLTVVDISFLNQLSDSAYVNNGDVCVAHERLKHLPASFVPNRNALFVTLAHAYAQKIGADTLVTGVCQTDYSGYPDCRADFITMIQNTLNYGSDAFIEIETPLMYLNKAQIFQMAEDYDVLHEVINLTHTCYNGDHEHLHEWGYGCGECPSCKLRINGYDEYLKNQQNEIE